MPTSNLQGSTIRWVLTADNSWLAGQVFQIPRSPAIIGRSGDCDITIPGTHLSRQHAEISIQGKLLYVRDLGSANGTYINNRRVSNGILRPGDSLRLDVYSFRITEPTQHRAQPRQNTSSKFQANDNSRDPEDPRRWKTRPTSPGNRPQNSIARTSKILPLLSALLLFAMVGALLFLLSLA